MTRRALFATFAAALGVKGIARTASIAMPMRRVVMIEYGDVYMRPAVDAIADQIDADMLRSYSFYSTRRPYYQYLNGRNAVLGSRDKTGVVRGIPGTGPRVL